MELGGSEKDLPEVTPVIDPGQDMEGAVPLVQIYPIPLLPVRNGIYLRLLDEVLGHFCSIINFLHYCPQSRLPLVIAILVVESFLVEESL
jgi:hypothetical protein